MAQRFDLTYGSIRNWTSDFRRSRDAGEDPPLFVSPHRGCAAADENDEVEIPVADVHALALERGRRIVSRHAGIFLFVPLLSRLRFDRLVTTAGDPGSQMIPATNALLSLLVLKLLDNERLRHIDDFNCLSSEVRLNVDLDTVLSKLNPVIVLLCTLIAGLTTRFCVRRISTKTTPKSRGSAITGWNSYSRNPGKSAMSKLAAEIGIEVQAARFLAFKL